MRKATYIIGMISSLCGLFGCTEKIEMRIPVRPVYLELDLTYQDKELNAIPSWKIYNQSNVDQAGEYTGFGGVLVYHGLDASGGDCFYAFDAACPYEASSGVTLSVDEAGIYAICPKCNSRFELLNGIGNPVEGVAAEARFRLKNYQVERSGGKIYVFN